MMLNQVETGMNLNGKTKISFVAIAGTLLSIAVIPAQAATVSFSDPVPDAGISYEWTVQMSQTPTDTANFTYHVGAKSWNEPTNPVGLKGWTHTSNWVALQLLQPTKLTIQVDRQAGVPMATGVAGNDLYPALSLYRGWENQGEEDHQYNTTGNTAWAPDISYLAHIANDAAAPSISGSFTLPAGLYSLAIGGNPPDPTQGGRQGYTATITSEAVPEPTTVSGFLLAGIGITLSKMRRQKSISR